MNLRRTCYRLHDPRWAFDPVSGQGAAFHGARFNRTGENALYLALSIEGAFLEIAEGFAGKFRPCTIVCYDVDCADIADLRTETGRRKHAVDLAEMDCAWFALKSKGAEPPSWRVARRLIDAGFVGLLAPSFAEGADPRSHHNLVLWNWSDEPPYSVIPYDPDERLPKDQSSWRRR